MILTITKVTQEFTKTGAEYRKIIGNDRDGKETTKSVFDNLKFLWPLLVESKEIELKLVQKGQFWNVINLKPADEPWPEETDAVKPKEVAKPKPETKTEPPRVRTNSQNRSFALSYAKDIACAKIKAGKPTSVNEVLDVTVLFESYLESGATVEKK